MPNKYFSGRNILLSLFWIFIGAFVFFYYGDHLISPDEGFVLNEAWQIWAGKKMYGDFLEYITPGSGYAIFFIWKIFGGPSYLSAKIFAMLLWLMSASFIYLSALKIFKRRTAGISAVIIWLFACRLHPIINHNIFSTYFSAGLFYFLLRYLTGRTGKNHAGNLALAGFFAALTFLFLQTKGLAVFGAGALSIIILAGQKISQSIRHTAAFAAVFLAAGALPLLYFDLPRMFFDIFLFPSAAGYMRHTYIVALYIFLEALIPLAIISAGYYKKNNPVIFIGIFQAALFLSCFNFLDMTHFLANSFPAWIFFSGGLIRALDKLDADNFSYGLLLTCALSAIILPMLIIAGHFRTEKYSENHILWIDIFGRKRQYIFEIPEIKAAEHIYSGPFYPGLYFEYRKPNPFYFFNMVLCDSECQARIVETFKQVRPEFSFLNYQDVKVLKYDIDSPIDYYIRNNYFYCQDLSRPPLYIYARDRCPPCPRGYVCNDKLK